MVKIRPFRGLRPQIELSSRIASKPYDVLNSEEARIEVQKEPLSFLQISKPEVHFDSSISPYADEVYEKGNEIFKKFIAEGYLQRDEEASMYVYSQVMNGRRQTGLVAGSSIDDYFNNIIKKHELTLIAKENDRIRHMKTKMAQPGMVFLTYRNIDEITAIINNIIATPPLVHFVDELDVTHQLWKISDSTITHTLQDLFATRVEASYIADGHHRSAASAKVGAAIRAAKGEYTGEEPFNYFLSCLFPSNQLQIIDYNRVIKDLNGYSSSEILEKIQENFEIEVKSKLYAPTSLHEFSMYLDGKWYALKAKDHTYDNNDPIKCLDVTVLSQFILDPILGIKDQRTDKRIDFVGGIRGLGELSKRVDSGEMAIAFAFFPVTLDQLMSIADNGMIMPPKSTWFEPKLKSGLVINLLDD
ncbi:MAG: DUF1015 family protein [Chitinophagales bacterium]|nr:DUF1015 family protein [Chitinophagales bacterium]MCZ2394176.1 DUF1015 family protein [Chitinophagales bacterium]